MTFRDRRRYDASYARFEAVKAPLIGQPPKLPPPSDATSRETYPLRPRSSRHLAQAARRAR